MTSTPEIPEHPTKPFDATGLSDEQIKSLDAKQYLWADCTEHQDRVWHENAVEYVRPPSENTPSRIPAPEQLEHIKELFDWTDNMGTFVRRPGGMAWIEIELMLASMTRFMDWARSYPPIDPHYRYRIDAPLNPNDSEVPDHIPDDWQES